MKKQPDKIIFEKREYWSELLSYKQFLDAVKESGMTYDKLRKVIFGNTAIKVIKAIRKDKKVGFDNIKKFHQAWYCFSVAASECCKSLSMTLPSH